MPNRDIHNLICELAGIDPDKANYVNHAMDLPSQLYGSQHRKFFHAQHSNKIKTPIGTIQVNNFEITPKDILELYALTNFDPDKIRAWVLHLIADGVAKKTITYYPNKQKKAKKHR